MIYRVKRIYKELPLAVRNFLIRALLLFAGWLLIYNLVLKPINVPDRQLTQFVEWGTVKTLSFFYPNVSSEGQDVLINNQGVLGIANQCNGLELIVLYIGFLFCLPTRPLRMLLYGVVGTIIICILNIGRCAALAMLYMSHNYYADFAHHYAFKLVVYAAVFFGWIIYSKNIGRNAQLQA
ncbi:MAG: hypothetical protein BGO69_13570 [Bacteroidetes bacterium 46-16]|nr:MAG: hypothetical protein BGO69_13570 [Bacteroidetes bacterium 46-16]